MKAEIPDTAPTGLPPHIETALIKYRTWVLQNSPANLWVEEEIQKGVPAILEATLANARRITALEERLSASTAGMELNQKLTAAAPDHTEVDRLKSSEHASLVTIQSLLESQGALQSEREALKTELYEARQGRDNARRELEVRTDQLDAAVAEAAKLREQLTAAQAALIAEGARTVAAYRESREGIAQAIGSIDSYLDAQQEDPTTKQAPWCRRTQTYVLRMAVATAHNWRPHPFQEGAQKS